MLDPMQALDMEAFRTATSSLLVPTTTPTPSVSPIPTVVPNVPTYETIGQSGKNTLWVSYLESDTFVIDGLIGDTGCLCDHVPLNSYLFLLGLESTSGKCFAFQGFSFSQFSTYWVLI